jgi:hypothetical protein
MDVPETDDLEFEDLIRYVQESCGLDFRGYKRSSLRRRMTIRTEKVGAEGFGATSRFSRRIRMSSTSFSIPS